MANEKTFGLLLVSSHIHPITGILWLIQKLLNVKYLNINKLSPLDTHKYVYASGGYSMLMFKSLGYGKFEKSLTEIY